ncbi:hypothetical protein [Nocardia sp. NPDC051463]|uniref:hypothetical protein n=1 Tax=Nocardia sp. NPDC051463 TaxID=3154845 RepID=UPI00344CEE66
MLLTTVGAGVIAEDLLPDLRVDLIEIYRHLSTNCSAARTSERSSDDSTSGSHSRSWSARSFSGCTGL